MDCQSPKFKIGDKVVLVEKGKSHFDEEGVGIVQDVMYLIHAHEYQYNIKFSVSFAWIKESMLIKTKEVYIVQTDEKTIRATISKETLISYTGEAKCGPDNEFDFAIGAKLALERALEKEVKANPQKYVALINYYDEFTKGKIYEVVNNFIIDDNGEKHSFGLIENAVFLKIIE